MELQSNSERPMHYFPKELSWLAFNERVLQEAADERNPLIERLRFLGIYSNNMDEFYRVRVADVKRRIMLQKYHQDDASETEYLLKQIQQFVLRLGAKFNAIHMDLQLGLRKHNIEFIDQHKLNESQSAWVKSYFKEKVLRHIDARRCADPLPPVVHRNDLAGRDAYACELADGGGVVRD